MTDQELPVVQTRPRDAVVQLRLNRPDRLNAVSLPLYQQLESALTAIADDRAVRAVVLTGTGRGFCVGADLKAHGSHEPTMVERRTYIQTGQRVNRLLQTLPLPVVAAVNGHAVGAGIELALSCDFIVVARDAKLRLPEIALGTFVGGGTVYTLPQRVGLAKAKELILLGEFFNGEQAVAMGLANRATDVESVLDESLAVAEKLAGNAPISMRLAKALLTRAQRMTVDDSLEQEAAALMECMGTRDWREGIDAFHEKREPRFRGE